MVANARLEACDGHLFKRLMEAGLAWLANNQEKVNQLNVFPVPDGDTGTNMYLTMQKAYEEIAHMDDAHVGNVSGALARGALMGARGNSGVILSQWWRGFAQTLEGHPVFDSQLFARACRNAVEMAYKGVVKPVEGTILTVTRQAMEAVDERARSENNLQSLFETKVEAAYESLRRTPELLPVLRDAGVVDSGGQGWTFMMEGMLRLLRGEDIHIRSVKAVTVQRPGWRDALLPEDEEGYGYDVQFLMKRLGQPFDVEVVRAAISEIGWSTLVVGDENLIKVHVHVHDPGVPISYAVKAGAMLDDVVVENMQLQYQHYVEERSFREGTPVPVEGVAVVTVASGDGLRRLFAEELRAAHVIAGGQTMNPSTEDFLAAIESLPNDEIILLPNNPNVIMAARQAAALAQDKHVRVVPSRTIPQGISAMMAYVNERESLAHETLAQAMDGMMADIVSCEVTTATRAALLNGVTVRAGQLIGLINDVLAVAGDDMVTVARELLRKAGADKRELITLYYGCDVTRSDAESLVETLQAEYSAQAFELIDGGQPLYPYIIGVE